MLIYYTFIITLILHYVIVGIYIREHLSTLSGQTHLSDCWVLYVRMGKKS